MDIHDNEQKSNVLDIISKLTAKVVGKFKLDEVLNEIVPIMMESFDAEVCSIFANTVEEPDVITCIAASGFAEPLVKNKSSYRKGHKSLTSYVFETGETINVKGEEDIKKFKDKKLFAGTYDNVQWTEKNEYRSGVVTPLKVGDTTFGVLKIENKKTDSHFSDEDVRSLKIIANIIALVVRNNYLYNIVENKEGGLAFRTAHIIGNAMFGLKGEARYMTEVINNGNLSLVDIKNLGDSANNVHTEIERLQIIVRDFKKIRSNIVNKKHTDIGNVLLGIRKKFSKEIAYIDIYTDILIKVFAFDTALLQQSINELIENATYHKKDNTKLSVSITTRIATEEDKILLGISPQDLGEYISIIVKDNGKGVKEDKKQEIFEPFKTTRAAGTGLGLTIVKQYIELHNGKIKEVGKEGEGAIFHILLPYQLNKE